MNDSANSGFRTVRGYQLAKRREGRLTPALEDYLEMTYRLCAENGYARVGKLAGLLHVRPPSASKMLAKLSDLGYLQYDRYEIIRLTGAGREAGSYLLRRHETLQDFLTMIGSADPLEETELVEHSLSASTVSDLSDLLAFFRLNPQVKSGFDEFKKIHTVEEPADNSIPIGPYYAHKPF